VPQLTMQQHQGLHGEGFIFALASSAGLTLARFNVDVDGVDWLIAHPGLLGGVRSPKIEVQVKSWSNPKGDRDSWHYRLSVKHFNSLAGGHSTVRRYLILVIAPEDPTEYAVVGDALELRHRAYWMTLADRQIVPDGTEDSKTVTVLVPKRNLLTMDSLRALVGGDHPGAVR
jgi:hypothetical protein